VGHPHEIKKLRPFSNAEVFRRVEQAQSAVDRLNGNKNNAGPYALYSKPKNGDKRFGAGVLRIEKDFVKGGR
jgi:hypothetical protein